jgi:MYXO-CTERM domain-containing protein
VTPRAPWLLAFVPAFVALAGCGEEGGHDRTYIVATSEAIHGGAPVPPHRFREVAALEGTCTGVLVSPALVVYAAHCGTAYESMTIGHDVTAPEREVAVHACTAHPDAALGNGFDVAFCVLDTPLRGVPIAPLLGELEDELLDIGTKVTLVGFGPASNDDTFGRKRSAEATVVALGQDLLIGSNRTGTCLGDSGGPALLDVSDAGDPPSYKTLALLSAGSSYECAVSTDHYSRLAGLRDWLEQESGIELTSDQASVAAGSEGCSVGRGHAPAPLLPLGLLAALGLVLRQRRVRRARTTPSCECYLVRRTEHRNFSDMAHHTRFFVTDLSPNALGFRLGWMGALLQFPVRRVKRPRRPSLVFAALADERTLERAQGRLFWGCALAATLLNVALVIGSG